MGTPRLVRVLITGASGFIGTHVSAALAAAGAETIAFCRSQPPGAAGAADWIPGELTDAAAVARAARGCEAILHVAALYSYRRTDAERMRAVNLGGTANVIRAAARGGARVVMTSSAATCGPVRGRPATEADRPPPWELQVPYKATKLAAERLALAAAADGVDVLCVNPTTVVGPGDRRPSPSGRMVRDLVDGRIRGYIAGAGINVVAATDVARGHLLALERGRAGERYLLGGDDLPLKDAFTAALDGIDRPPPRVPLAWPLVYAAGLLADRLARSVGREPSLLVLDEIRLARLPLYFSSAKAQRELGYRAGPATEALAAAARWFADPDRASRRTASPAVGSRAVAWGVRRPRASA